MLVLGRTPNADVCGAVAGAVNIGGCEDVGREAAGQRGASRQREAGVAPVVVLTQAELGGDPVSLVRVGAGVRVRVRARVRARVRVRVGIGLGSGSGLGPGSGLV